MKISAVFCTKQGVSDGFSSSTGDYQIPLERPPGGARIRAEDLFGMWSSTWDPKSIRNTSGGPYGNNVAMIR